MYNSTTPCHACNKELKNKIVCAYCNKIQHFPKEDISYFDYLGFPQEYNLSLQNLEKLYLDVQTTLHPDRQANRSLQERRDAQKHAPYTNEAYMALKDPLKRAECLLRMSGSGDESACDPDTLMSMMTHQEQLASSRDQKHIKTMIVEAEAFEQKTIHNLMQAFQEKNVGQASQTMTVLRYAQKWHRDARLKLLQSLTYAAPYS